MNIKKYFWNLNEKAIKETEQILKNPYHPKFVNRVFTILSRTNNVGEMFSLINKKQFIEIWPKVHRYWLKIGQAMDFHAWWETIYEKLADKPKIVHKGEFFKEFRSIGRSIRVSRVNKGWTQSDLAKRAGMKQPHISAIEKGNMNITLETLIKLCRILQIGDGLKIIR